MAFKFFRKRQKLIFVIMVLLMVSFLIGYQGLSMFFKPAPHGEKLVGKAPDFEITYDMLNQANSDLSLLRKMAMGFGFRSEQWVAFTVLTNGQDSSDAPLEYMILLEAAKQQGVGVTDREIDQAIAQMDMNGSMGGGRVLFNWKALAKQLREGSGQITETKLRGVLARWLVVFKAYREANPTIAPSNTQVMRTYRDTKEQIALLTCTLPASKFAGKPDKNKASALPDEKKIAEHFAKYKNRQPNEYAGVEDFPFGYRSLPKADIAYIIINSAAITSGTPNDKTPADMQATTAGDLDRTIAKLSEKDSGVAVGDVMSKAVEEQTISADNLLNRKVLLISIDKLPLDKAMKVLAGQAAPTIDKICFPAGQYGDIKIDPETKVSISARNTTVAKVLEDITKQLSKDKGKKMPKISWACCKGFNNVLFPVAGVRFFPVTAGKTGLKTQEQLKADTLIATTYRQSPEVRGVLAGFPQYAQAINPRAPWKVGQPTPPVGATLDGKNVELRWRLTQVQPSQSPKELTPELKVRVIADLKKIAAYDLAVAAAKNVTTFDALTKLAKDQKLKTVDTGFFARRTF
ncbi:MAG: SurA N-terminal domain-containing protein, partial [Phycisphaerae bacterium]|nr:SurA N-terminal domain-containing protein [Phycisphaerae bacterium]